MIIITVRIINVFNQKAYGWCLNIKWTVKIKRGRFLFVQQFHKMTEEPQLNNPTANFFLYYQNISPSNHNKNNICKTAEGPRVITGDVSFKGGGGGDHTNH